MKYSPQEYVGIFAIQTLEGRLRAIESGRGGSS